MLWTWKSLCLYSLVYSNYVYIHNLSLLNRFHDDSKNIVIALRIILWYLLKVLLFEKVSKFKKKHATVPFRWLRVVGTIFFWLIAYLKTARSTRLSMNGMSNTIFGLWQPYDRLAFNKRKLLCSPRLNPGMKLEDFLMIICDKAYKLDTLSWYLTLLAIRQRSARNFFKSNRKTFCQEADL